MRFLKYGAMFLLLSFCAPWVTVTRQAEPVPQCAVVVRAELRHSLNGQHTERVYTMPEKLEAVLTYLRLLKTAPLHGEDPEMIAGDRFQIWLYYSDGSQRHYRQHACRFLSVDRRPWQAIEPGFARDLYVLMDALPGDGGQ